MGTESTASLSLWMMTGSGVSAMLRPTVPMCNACRFTTAAPLHQCRKAQRIFIAWPMSLESRFMPLLQPVSWDFLWKGQAA